MRRSWAERRSARRLQASYDEVTTPPEPSRWGAFGDSYVVPPLRAERPDLVHIADGVLILEGAWMSVVAAFDDVVPRLVFERGVRIGRGCQFSLAGEVVIGEGALVGDFVHIADTYHPYEQQRRLPHVVRPRPVRIGAGAVLASHVVVLPGVTVGDGAVVDHHAVVDADVPPRTVVAGNPARLVRRG